MALPPGLTTLATEYGIPLLPDNYEPTFPLTSSPIKHAREVRALVAQAFPDSQTNRDMVLDTLRRYSIHTGVVATAELLRAQPSAQDIYNATTIPVSLAQMLYAFLRPAVAPPAHAQHATGTVPAPAAANLRCAPAGSIRQRI